MYLTSAIFGLSGAILGWSGAARTAKKDGEKRAESSAIMRTDIEYIKRGIDDIRVQQVLQTTRLDEHTERLIRVELRSDAAHSRLDQIGAQRADRTGA